MGFFSSVGKFFKKVISFTPIGIAANLVSSLFSSPDAPALPPPPALAAPAAAEIPTRTDPAIAVAKEKQRLSEKRRRGRSAAILSSDEDDLGATQVARPGARAGATVLG